MRVLAAILIVALSAGAALAKPPKTSLRPMARAGIAMAVARAVAETPPIVPRVARVRPMARPDAVTVQPAPQPQQVAMRRPDNPRSVLRPRQRSQEAQEQSRRKQAARVRGAVCGDPDIQGVLVGPVGGPGGCGVSEAVRVSSISGVALSTHSVMDCGTAKSLKSWIDKGMQPAAKRRGGVSQIRIAAHYACRTRNNQKGAKLSEHARGRAVDIAGFTLRDGTRISVLEGWNTRKDGPVLRQMHAKACGPFGTVLGPDANAFHRDHFHFDTARYRSGSYCR